MCDWLKQAHNLPHHIKGKELVATTPDSRTFIFGWSDKRFAKWKSALDAALFSGSPSCFNQIIEADKKPGSKVGVTSIKQNNSIFEVAKFNMNSELTLLTNAESNLRSCSDLLFSST